MINVNKQQPLVGCNVVTALALTTVIAGIALLALSGMHKLPPYGYAGGILIPVGIALPFMNQSRPSSESNIEDLVEVDVSKVTPRNWANASKQGLSQMCRKIAEDYRTEGSAAGMNLFFDNAEWGIQRWGLKGPLKLGAETHPANCAFCSEGNVVETYNGINLLSSKSGRPLLIPTGDQIPVHWFEATPEVQVKLLQAAQQLHGRLQKVLPDEEFSISFNCGEPAGQTQWHLHLRVNARGGWKGTGWQERISNIAV